MSGWESFWAAMAIAWSPGAVLVAVTCWNDLEPLAVAYLGAWVFVAGLATWMVLT